MISGDFCTSSRSGARAAPRSRAPKRAAPASEQILPAQRLEGVVLQESPAVVETRPDYARQHQVRLLAVTESRVELRGRVQRFDVGGLRCAIS